MPAFPRIFVVSVSAAAATALTLGIAGVASASDGDAVETCESFETQKDAQIAFEADLLGLANLDIELLGEKNGIACDKPKKDDEDDEDDDDDKKKKDDEDDDDDDEDEKKDDSDDDSQVKVKPKGGVDTGGWVISA